MFGFLNAIGLFALAAVMVPVVIHLWDTNPGKTLKIGSISLMSEAARKSSLNLKLTDLPLLLLRCLLLILLAFLLALPFLRQRSETQKVKGWLLIPKQNIRESYKKFKPVIDQLNKAGYAFHYFNSGFKTADLQKILTDTALRDEADDSTNYWSLINKLDRVAPSNIPVYVITGNGLKHFAGSKPSATFDLHWLTYAPADATSKWIDKAWFTPNNEVDVSVGNSGPSGTSFANYTVKTDAQRNSPFIIDVKNGTSIVSFKDSRQAAVTIDTATDHIAVFTDKYDADAGYLQAAVTAAINFEHRKAVVKVYHDASLIAGEQDQVFWLSDQPFNAAKFQQAKFIFAYQDGKVAAEDSWIYFENGAGQHEKITLSKLIGCNDENATPVWTDGFGRPVLSATKAGQTMVYHFYTHFNPLWNDLVWDDSFPKQLLLLLNGDKETVSSLNDRRIIDNKQLRPDATPATANTAVTTPEERTDLSHYFWLAIVLLFVAERWLAHKQKKIVING